MEKYPSRNIELYNARNIIRDFYNRSNDQTKELISILVDNYLTHSGINIPNPSSIMSKMREITIDELMSVIESSLNSWKMELTIKKLVSSIRSNFKTLKTIDDSIDIEHITWKEWDNTVCSKLLSKHTEFKPFIEGVMSIRTIEDIHTTPQLFFRKGHVPKSLIIRNTDFDHTVNTPGTDFDNFPVNITGTHQSHSFVNNPMISYGLRSPSFLLINKYRVWRCCNRYEYQPGCWVGRHSSIKSDPDLYDSFSSMQSENVARENMKTAAKSNRLGVVITNKNGILYGDKKDVFPSSLMFINDDMYIKSQRGSYRDMNMGKKYIDNQIRSLLDSNNTPLTIAGENFIFKILKLEQYWNVDMRGIVQFPWKDFLNYVSLLLPDGLDSLIMDNETVKKNLKSKAFELTRERNVGLTLGEFISTTERFMEGEWSQENQLIPSSIEEGKYLSDMKILIFKIYKDRMRSAYDRVAGSKEGFSNNQDAMKKANFPSNQDIVFDARWEKHLPRCRVWYIDADRGYYNNNNQN